MKPKVMRAVVLVNQLGITILTPIFLCVFLGQFLSNRFQQEWIFLLLLLLGVLAAIRNAYILLKNFIKNEEIRDKHDKDKYWRNE